MTATKTTQLARARNSSVKQPTLVAQRRLLQQHLGAQPFTNVSQVVHWLGAVQAQDFAGAKWALGVRTTGTTDAAVEAAFNSGKILRTHLLRPTWHFVTPDDIQWLLALTAPRVQALCAPHYRKVGLDTRLLARCNDILGRELEGGQHRTREALRDVFAQHDIETTGELRLGYLLMNAELEGVVCSGPRVGKQFTYALLAERTPRPKAFSRDESLATLVKRYFHSRGPATVHDCAKWSGLTVGDVRAGINAVQNELSEESIEGQNFWSSKSAPVPGETSGEPRAFLLSVFDELLSSYKDRSALVNAAYGERLASMGNALTAIVVLDAQIIGTWKRLVKKDTVILTTDIPEPLSTQQQQAVSLAAEEYAAFLQLPLVYQP
jgi:hypothetical protein